MKIGTTRTGARVAQYPTAVRAVVTALLLATLVAPGLTACDGGGGGGGNPITVTAINLNPGTPSAGSVVALSVSATGSGASAATKEWTVSVGTLQLAQPDFSLLLRGTATAKTASASSLSTTQQTVYWITPATAGSATVTCAIGGSSKQRSVSTTASPVTLTVSDAAGGKKTCTVAVHGVVDLYQAAFRVNFGGAWTPETVTQGNFLGAAADTLFIGLKNLTGFVPVAITRKGAAGGVDGDGTLGTITFKPKAASGVHGASDVPEESFDLGLVILRNSHDEPLVF